ncbi:MAG: hypothetical protein E6Y08_14780 [Paenibacillus sp.]|uniref:hypothetical protein n=1 Tax=Paenibacillus sp. TaxID=58172 RepID=UPI002909FD9D|nr:hypothetical protein [Paenibacillus sp.]MDU4697076.1 hypothetical protein [Paenibacillus sp.]
MTKQLTDYELEEWLRSLMADSTDPEGLDLHLSVIFQTVWQERGNPDRVTVQKFLVEDNESITQAFVHMVNVFWHSAFGRPPGEIEVIQEVGRIIKI